MPSLDGRPLPAIPIQMALKFRPPTIAVIYKMKDNKTLKMKKYIHEILITFPEDTENIDVNRMCDEICRKDKGVYLNPAFISRQQVSIYNPLLILLFIGFGAPRKAQAQPPEDISHYCSCQSGTNRVSAESRRRLRSKTQFPRAQAVR